MADHFYAMDPSRLGAIPDDYSNLTVGTSSAGADTIELRVPDGLSLTRQQVSLFCEQLAPYFATAPSLPVLLG